MDKDSFIDTNVIVHYANYQKDKSIEIVSRCYSYISNKSGKFIICYAVYNELFNVIQKLSIIHKEVLAKVENPGYSINKSNKLSERDISSAEKLYLIHKNTDVKKLSKIFASEREIFEIKIEQFLKYQLDEKVISIENIRIELVNKIREIIKNYSDCKILASAFQCQQDREIFKFVTADGEDLDPNGYEFLKGHIQTSKLIKEPIFPEFVNLMFVD
jgi:predicted nucleic acid-binding protein